MDEAGPGEELQQHRNAARMWRRFQYKPPGVLEGQKLQVAVERLLPLRDLSPREPVQIEIFGTYRAIVGKSDCQVLRRQAQVAQGELIFEGLLPARRHVVHGTVARTQKPEPACEKALR